ncbi:DNA repair protein RecN [Janibacter melonis]|uniref:DNA repair protein RecN n=1 Tax=Janibacter melonis TaxID=262209 RepID=UPI002044B6EE|nr:DNA repair protein RecN [Janibacter melonis]MCM3556048.1 DNA repair protein RecN [Janibacter melonis]
MIEEIRIRDLGVIEEATVSLHPGLTVLTGETGAGKTMLVSSIELLLGSRADAALVRTGAQEAAIDAVLEVADPELARAADDAGASVEDGELTVSRVLRSTGRSRAYAGGRTVPVGTLGEITQGLVALHGQADQWRLRQSAQHREVLDAYGGDPVREAATAFASARRAWFDARRELDELTTSEQARAQELDALTYQLEQVDAVDPRPGEDLELRAESERLAHADDLRLGSARAHAALADGELPERPDTLALLATAEQSLGPLVDADPGLAPLRDRLVELRALVADVAADLSSYSASIEVDPARLDAVHTRRAALSELTRRYGGDVDAVLARRDRSRARVLELQQADDRLGGMAEQVESAAAEVARRAADLTAARTTAAERLGARVQEELRRLGMPQAVVEVSVTPTTGDGPDSVPAADLEPGERVVVGAHGVDVVEIRLSANPGSPARPVTQAASGGELSRIMLALEVAVADAGASVPTFVFDEVDAGVGGKAGIDVGARLQALARNAQVLVVTHLAQVAAHADRHLVVRKSTDGEVTSSDVSEVSGEDRLAELARMMGGAGTSAGLRHAEELLDACRRPAG